MSESMLKKPGELSEILLEMSSLHKATEPLTEDDLELFMHCVLDVIHPDITVKEMLANLLEDDNG